MTSTARSEVLPDLPTVADFLTGYEASAWYGLGVPKSTPDEIIDKVNKAVNQHILYDELWQDGTDGNAANDKAECRNFTMRYKRPDGTTALRRENRCN